jgi:imidazolonepropionase-like amidohydrolase
MQKLICTVIISALLFSIYSQETTFKTNGPDDFRSNFHAFTNATLFVAYNKKVDSATLIIKNGIVINSGKGINIPNGAIIHDLKGKYIYPSFIDAYSDYGIIPDKPQTDRDEQQLESNVKGAYGWNHAIRSTNNAADQFQLNETSAEELRKQGFGAVLTHNKNGIARGTGILVSLAHEKENLVIIKDKASAHYSFSKGTSTQDYPGSLMGSIALLRQTYLDAQWYAGLKDKKEFNLSLEAWNQSQSLPQVFEANDWGKMIRADKVGDEFGVQYIIKTNGNEYQRIEEVKATKAPLITTVNFPKAFDVEDPYKATWVSLEEMKHWELAPGNLSVLQKNGIEFLLTTADLEKKDDFLKNLRIAVKYGLAEEAALKALIYTPAHLFKAADKVGSLETGRQANFIIASKPIFNTSCIIYENWIQGKKYLINAIEPKDIRGDYLIDIFSKDTLKYSRLQFSGDGGGSKAQITLTDTQKLEIKLSRKDQEISLAFSPKKADNGNLIRLNGTINYENYTITGTGQLTTGEWVNWRARRIKVFQDSIKTEKPDTLNLANLGKVIYPFTAYGSDSILKAENVWLRNGTVWTNETEDILQNADVIIKAGKIAATGKSLSCTDCRVVDCTGKYITSGIIDEHSHIAITGGVNEGTKSSSAEVRIGDVVDCEDIDIYRHLAGGVTACQLLHGSANPIGGQAAMVKMRWGSTFEQMKVAGADGFIKFALGENVKQSNWGDRFRVRYPQSRMGVEQTYYNYFTKAKEYKDGAVAATAKSKNPPLAEPARRDLELEALKEILLGKRFITCHSYVQSEINMLMHVADSFGFRVNTFTHILEGYKIADKMRAHGVNASTFSDWWAYKMEVLDAIPYNAAMLTQMGINTAINSDDAEMARRLNQEASKTIKYGGMSEAEAWKMVTLNPAKMLHLEKQMGSLKAGKDADVVVWSDNPLSIYAKVESTFVDGICYYSKERDEKLRQYISAERARLMQKMLNDKKTGGPTQEPVKKEKIRYACSEEEAHTHQ